MDQIFFLISLLMSVLMLVVLGFLGRKKSLKSIHTLLIGLAGGSYGAFFSGAMGGFMSRGHYIFASLSLILGFTLAIAVGALFLWHRLRPLSFSDRERHSQPHQEMIQTNSRYH